MVTGLGVHIPLTKQGILSAGTANAQPTAAQIEASIFAVPIELPSTK